MATLTQQQQLSHDYGEGGGGQYTATENDAVFTLQRKTPLQLRTLEHLYADEKNPSTSRMEDYASGLGLMYEQVRGWYIERRRRDKKNGSRSKVTKGSFGTKEKRKNKKVSSVSIIEEDGSCTRRPNLVQDMPYSTDYISTKIFRNDGPPLGVEFDCLPSTSFQGCDNFVDVRNFQPVCQDEERVQKRRKVSEIVELNNEQQNQSRALVKKHGMGKGLLSLGRAELDTEQQNQTRAPLKKHGMGKGLMSLGRVELDTEQQNQARAPFKKHGMGKGLMSLGRLVNSNGSCRQDVRVSRRRKVIPGTTRSLAKRHGIGKGLMKDLRLANRDTENVRVRKPPKRKPAARKRSIGKSLEKKKPPARQRNVQLEYIHDDNQKGCREICNLALDVTCYEDSLSSCDALADDEELELMELQGGPNPLTCAHFATGGTHGCSLCKGLLPKFPPDSVSLRKPLSVQPWNSSLELLKNVFKVFQFLYTYDVVLDLCTFTLDEFAEALHEKDSLLLIGKLHVKLVGFLLSDIETDLSSGPAVISSKNDMYLNLLKMAQSQLSVVTFWKASLNVLTWTEILRQILVAAGFGTKVVSSNKDCGNKEVDHLRKYGLAPGTLKGELFSTLLEQGNRGMNIASLANASRIVDLNLGKTTDELEDSICSTLASDITLFEKISSSAYRVRAALIVARDEGSQSDSEDCGSIDNEFRDSTLYTFSNPSSISGNIISSLCTEIDESHPGESWLLGLMEGEYSDLNIDEKLNILQALVDLVSAGPSFRREELFTTLAECGPSVYQHGFGGKIKRSSFTQATSPTSSLNDIRENCGVEKATSASDSLAAGSSMLLQRSCLKENFSFRRNHSIETETRHYLHPMQSIFLGSDRRYNRYWLFLGPCDIYDPGHSQIYFESSEDGSWAVIDSEEALFSLFTSLNSQGRREAALKASLEKRMTILLKEMSSRVAPDLGVSHSIQSDISEIDRVNEGSPSPISDIDNGVSQSGDSNLVSSTGATIFDSERKVREQRRKRSLLQAYDSWIWSSFYASLSAVKYEKRSFFESWARCGSCHDLYWRDERHCKTCHKTFELDLDTDEKYAIHIAKCQDSHHFDDFPIHKILSPQLQALKAAIHAIELNMPENSLIGSWKKSAHKLWVRRLRRTSSLHELSLVLADFVGAIHLDWLSQCSVLVDCFSTPEDVVACFHSMPKTLSAVALWLVNLDRVIASQLNEGLGAEAT